MSLIISLRRHLYHDGKGGGGLEWALDNCFHSNRIKPGGNSDLWQEKNMKEGMLEKEHVDQTRTSVLNAWLPMI